MAMCTRIFCNLSLNRPGVGFWAVLRGGIPGIFGEWRNTVLEEKGGEEMIRRLAACAAAMGLLVFVAVAAGRAENLPPYTGMVWLRASELERLVYVHGALDQFGVFGPFKRSDCLAKRHITVRQVYDTAKKWLTDHPEKEDTPMVNVVNIAIGMICP